MAYAGVEFGPAQLFEKVKGMQEVETQPSFRILECGMHIRIRSPETVLQLLFSLFYRNELK